MARHMRGHQVRFDSRTHLPAFCRPRQSLAAHRRGGPSAKSFDSGGPYTPNHLIVEHGPFYGMICFYDSARVISAIRSSPQ